MSRFVQILLKGSSFFFSFKFLSLDELQKILNSKLYVSKVLVPVNLIEAGFGFFPISRFPTATLPSFTFSGKHHLSDE
jgi:hypothetical protein